MQQGKTSPAPATIDIVAGWLAAESEATPDCEVVRAIKECSQAMKLDEAKLLARLRLLGKSEAETDVSH